MKKILPVIALTMSIGTFSIIHASKTTVVTDVDATKPISIAKLKSINDPIIEDKKIEGPVVEAVSVDEQEFINRISQIKSLVADFIQTEQGVNHSNNELKGKLFLNKPNRLRWEIVSPAQERQQYITNGNKFWHYDQNLEQVVVDTFDSKRITSSPLYFLLMNSDKVTEMYQVNKISEDVYALKTKPYLEKNKPSDATPTKTEPAVEMESEVILGNVYKSKEKSKSANQEAAEEVNPELNDNYVTELNLGFDHKTKKLSQISFVAAKSKTIIINLKNVQVNTGIKNNIFDFNPPKGIDIINASELYE